MSEFHLEMKDLRVSAVRTGDFGRPGKSEQLLLMSNMYIDQEIGKSCH
jgi:hypothetical protein